MVRKRPLPKDFAEVVALWPNARELGRRCPSLGHPRNAATWASTNYIPHKYWNEVVEAADACGFNTFLEEPGITYALLASLPRPERG